MLTIKLACYFTEIRAFDIIFPIGHVFRVLLIKLFLSSCGKIYYCFCGLAFLKIINV